MSYISGHLGLFSRRFSAIFALRSRALDTRSTRSNVQIAAPFDPIRTSTATASGIRTLQLHHRIRYVLRAIVS